MNVDELALDADTPVHGDRPEDRPEDGTVPGSSASCTTSSMSIPHCCPWNPLRHPRAVATGDGSERVVVLYTVESATTTNLWTVSLNEAGEPREDASMVHWAGEGGALVAQRAVVGLFFATVLGGEIAFGNLTEEGGRVSEPSATGLFSSSLRPAYLIEEGQRFLGFDDDRGAMAVVEALDGESRRQIPLRGTGPSSAWSTNVSGAARFVTVAPPGAVHAIVTDTGAELFETELDRVPASVVALADMTDRGLAAAGQDVDLAWLLIEHDGLRSEHAFEEEFFVGLDAGVDEGFGYTVAALSTLAEGRPRLRVVLSPRAAGADAEVHLIEVPVGVETAGTPSVVMRGGLAPLIVWEANRDSVAELRVTRLDCTE